MSRTGTVLFFFGRFGLTQYWLSLETLDQIHCSDSPTAAASVIRATDCCFLFDAFCSVLRHATVNTDDVEELPNVGCVQRRGEIGQLSL